MPVDSTLRSLNIDLPSQPQVLVQLSLLMAEDDFDFRAMGSLIEGDMALASAVLKALNSPIYGLQHQVRTVQQAIQFLGSKEVASITYEMGLKSVFPPAPELDSMWFRANRRATIMALMAKRLGVDSFIAHSAGLFEECGKAVMYRHAPDRYAPMLKNSPSDDLLVLQEMQAFGVSHDALGAALCETWMLAPPAITSVRYHVVVHSGGTWPEKPAAKPLCALSTISHYLFMAPDKLDQTVAACAILGGLDEEVLMSATLQARSVLEAAATV